MEIEIKKKRYSGKGVSLFFVSGFCSFGDLTPFVVHFEVVSMDQFGDRDDLKTLFLQSFQDGIQYLRGVFGIVVEEDDGAIA